MDAEWLTHREAAKRLGSNIYAVRQRAIAAAGLELSVTTSAEARVEILKAQLAASEARAAQEAENTARAIKAFADLARQLNALVAERTRRPWWRRLPG
jgi:hypothetical protein